MKPIVIMYANYKFIKQPVVQNVVVEKPTRKKKFVKQKIQQLPTTNSESMSEATVLRKIDNKRKLIHKIDSIQRTSESKQQRFDQNIIERSITIIFTSLSSMHNMYGLML